MLYSVSAFFVGLKYWGAGRLKRIKSEMQCVGDPEGAFPS